MFVMQPMPNTQRACALALAAVAALLATACTEFATPAELAKPQILAIRVEPPSVPPGASTELSILVADSDGPIESPDVTWTVAGLMPGTPPIGEVVGVDGGGAIYTAPGEVAETPTFGSVQASVQVGGDGLPLIAIKGVLIGNLPLANPILTAFTIGGNDALAGGPVVLQAGETVALSITAEPDISDTSSVAWYSTVGLIEAYQSSPAELQVSETPGAGWVIVVARDGLGGISWREVPVTVEQ